MTKGKGSNGKESGSERSGKGHAKNASLQQRVEQIYDETCELVAADGDEEQVGERKQRAQDLQTNLNALLPLLQTANIADKSSVMEMWAKAVVNADAVLRGEEETGQGDSGLQRQLDQVNRRTLELAKEVAAGTGDPEQRKSEARKLNKRLDELWPQVEAAPAGTQAALNQAWSDARLDLGYVLSDGDAPTSIRFFHYLQDIGRA